MELRDYEITDDLGSIIKFGKILEIDSDYEETRDGFIYEGFKVVTRYNNKLYHIILTITTEQKCCENAGYISYTDNSMVLSDLLNSNIEQVIFDSPLITNELIAKKSNLELYDRQFDFSIHDAIFIDFVTDNGVFTLTVYNEHNGYYAHDVNLKVIQFNLEQETINQYFSAYYI